MQKKFFVLILTIMMFLFSFIAFAEANTLTIYSGAGLMHPMDELKAMYEKEHPETTIQMIYAGSGELFGIIGTRKTGDVFIPGSEKYIQDASERGYIEEETIRDLCYHIPVILTPADNPANITGIEDLAKPKIRVAIADPKAAAIGKVAIKILKKNNIFDKVMKNCVVKPSTTNQLLIYTATKQIDATIAWEDQALWGQAKGKVEVIHIPPQMNIIKTIPAAVVTYSKQKEEAIKFVEYISSPTGKTIWLKWGFPIEKP